MKTFGLLLVCIFTLFVSGCGTMHPIYNVTAQPVVTAPGSTAANLNDVSKAILRAGTTLGWNMKVVEPGYIVGTLNLREHTASVDVRYTPQAYSIKYKDSTNLNYDGASIHRNYNGWIQNLDKGIRAQLLNL